MILAKSITIDRLNQDVKNKKLGNKTYLRLNNYKEKLFIQSDFLNLK
jgi:hypothetical protein